MPPETTCPPPEMIQRLMLGQVPGDDAGPLEKHLAQCTRCCQLVDTMEAESSFVEVLRSQLDALDEPENARIESLIEELCMLSTAPGASVTETGNSVAAEELVDFLAPPEAPDEMGRLGRYRIIKLLGAGGMGVVFEAEDPRLKRRVALKVMKPSLAASGSARKRFLREARATAAIEHDHIITIHEVGEHDNVPYLAMQLLEGEALAERLHREATLPPSEVLRIARQIAAGLAAAHDRGVVHRDIKPDNVWMEPHAEGPRVRILSQRNDGQVWQEIPSYLAGMRFLQYHSWNQATTRLEVLRGGVVLLVVTTRWGEGGGPGPWLDEVISRDEFLAQGWRAVGRIDDSTHHGHKWTVFYRPCKAGEVFNLRTEKYRAPIVLVREEKVPESDSRMEASVIEDD